MRMTELSLLLWLLGSALTSSMCKPVGSPSRFFLAASLKQLPIVLQDTQFII
jgi:hypothetical protein